MRLYIALRLLREQHAKVGIEAVGPHGLPRGQLIDSNITRLFPALRNIALHLTSTERLPDTREGSVLQVQNGKLVVERTATFRIFWCEIETNLPLAYWQSQKEVEAVIPKRELQTFASSIRHRGGAAYIEACENYADKLDIRLHSSIGYVPPRSSSTRAA